MKHMKWLVPLAVVVLILMIAIPAAADDPFGGPPSKTSGNGTSTWAAIYVGGTWDNKRDSNVFYKDPYSGCWPGQPAGTTYLGQPCSSQTGVVDSVEYDRYVTNWSAKVTIPGGYGARWFKFDTVKSRDVEVYVDDVPKWGAAYRYFDDQDCRFSGVGDCDKADNLLRIGINTSEIGKAWLATEDRNDFSIGDTIPGRNGVWARLWGPEAINNSDYFWPAPNNALLTTRNGSRARVADTRGGYGGYNRGTCSMLCSGSVPVYMHLTPADSIKMGDGNTHLLGGKFHLDGWVYMRVYNVMIWDGDFVVGTRYTPREGYDFPCSNCPYPFNP